MDEMIYIINVPNHTLTSNILCMLPLLEGINLN